MKPYRGMLLTAAALLAVLSLASCGDADKYAQSGNIVLKLDTTPIVVNEEVHYTVTSVATPPMASIAPTSPSKEISPNIPECKMDLEYRVKGANIGQDWTDIPGSGSTRTFSVIPRDATSLSVIARGRCIDSKEDWDYSDEIITDVPNATLPSVELSPNPSSVAKMNAVTFALSVTSVKDCDVALNYEYSGAGFVGVTKVQPAYVGQFILTPTATGHLVVTARGWCTQSPSKIAVKTIDVAVTDATITTPDTPTGAATVAKNAASLYLTGGAVCSNGDMVEYQFAASGSPNQPSPSAWSTTPSITFTWANAGSYTVTAKGRCQSSPSIVSTVSAGLAVTVTP